jgi:hypothetical protein
MPLDPPVLAPSLGGGSAINPAMQEAAVDLGSPEAVDMALHLTGTRFADRNLIITKVADGRKFMMSMALAMVEAARAPAHPAPGVVGGGMMSGAPPFAAGGGGGPGPVRDSLASRTVYMSGVPAAANIRAIANHFAACGQILQVKDLKQTGATKLVKIEFGAALHADAAVHMDGQEMQGSPLKISKSMNIILGYGPGARAAPPTAGAPAPGYGSSAGHGPERTGPPRSRSRSRSPYGGGRSRSRSMGGCTS